MKRKKRGLAFNTLIPGIISLFVLGIVAYVTLGPTLKGALNETFDIANQTTGGEEQFSPYTVELTEEEHIVLNSANAFVDAINALAKHESLIEEGIDILLVKKYQVTPYITYESNEGSLNGYNYNSYMTFTETNPKGEDHYIKFTEVSGDTATDTKKVIFYGDKKQKNATLNARRLFGLKAVKNFKLKAWYTNGDIKEIKTFGSGETTKKWWKGTDLQPWKQGEDRDGDGISGSEEECFDSPTWLELPGIKMYYCGWCGKSCGLPEFEKAIKVRVVSCLGCTKPDKNVQRNSNWNFIGDNFKAISDKQAKFIGISIDQHKLISCTTNIKGVSGGKKYGSVCVECPGGVTGHCSIKNFTLPQTIPFEESEKWIKGQGDPRWLIYSEAFPQGEEEGWQIDVLDVMTDVVLFGAGLNAITLGFGSIWTGAKSAVKTSWQVTKSSIKEPTLAVKSVLKGGKEIIKTSTRSLLHPTQTASHLWTKSMDTIKKLKEKMTIFKNPKVINSVYGSGKVIITKETTEKLVNELTKRGITDQAEIAKLIAFEYTERSVKELEKKYALKFTGGQREAIATAYMNHMDSFGVLTQHQKINFKGAIKDIIPENKLAEFTQDIGVASSKKIKHIVEYLTEITKIHDDFIDHVSGKYVELTGGATKFSKKSVLKYKHVKLNKELIESTIKDELPKFLDNFPSEQWPKIFARAEKALARETTNFNLPWRKILLRSGHDIEEEAIQKIVNNFDEIIESSTFAPDTLEQLKDIAKSSFGWRWPLENKRYLVGLGFALLQAYSDNLNEKYAAVGVNSIAITTPSFVGDNPFLGPKLVSGDNQFHGLVPEAKPYFIRLDKEGKDQKFTNRFFLASPCKIDLGLVRQKCTCAGELAKADEDGNSAYWIREYSAEYTTETGRKNSIISKIPTKSGTISGDITIINKEGFNHIFGGDDEYAIRKCDDRGWWDQYAGFYNNYDTESNCIDVYGDKDSYTDYNNEYNYCYTGSQWGQKFSNVGVIAVQIAIEGVATFFLGPVGTVVTHIATGAAGAYAQSEIAKQYKWPTP